MEWDKDYVQSESEPGEWSKEFWEEELRSLFGHTAVHYAFECTKSPIMEEYIGTGGVHSFWVSGKNVKFLSASTDRYSYPDYGNFREDILYPTLEKVEKIKVPTKLSPTEKPAETTPTPTAAPTAAPTTAPSSTTPTSTTSPTTAPSSTTGTAKVYVNNEYDDMLDIDLYLDDDYEDSEYVPSGAWKYHHGDYELSAGHHTFKIEWIDYESGEDDEAEVSEYISAGETTTVTLTAEKREVVVPTPVPTDIATFMDILPDNPSAMKGIVAAGVPPQNARNYESSGKYLSLNDYVPQTPADTWEDVARYEFLKGKMHSKKAQVEGNFNIVYKALSWISKAISLKADVKDIGTQYKTLDSISLSKLTSNPKLIADFANNMANIYAETSKTDSEVMRFIGSLSSAYTSEGLSAYTHVSNFIMSELKQSEHYDMEQATLGYSKAYHAMRMDEIATKKDVTEEEVKEYFRHVKAFLLLKKTEARVDYRETYATWGGTGVFSRSSIAIITDALGITTGESRLEGLENYNVVCVKWLERLDTNIEYMDSLEKELLGVGA